MTLDKTHLIVFVVGVALGLLSGFFSGKAIYDKPIVEKVERDTVTIHDTIPDINPVPKDSARIKYVTRWLPAKHDTIHHFANASNMIHDTVAVEVPITSKHYGNEQYDAWVSGFEPSLDSIKVYQKTQVITETVTKVKPPSKFGIGVQCGYGYGILSKRLEPYVGFGVEYRF